MSLAAYSALYPMYRPKTAQAPEEQDEPNGIEEATRAHVAATRDYEKAKERYDKVKKKLEECEVRMKEANKRLQGAKNAEYARATGYW
jgi:hypothetical protein